MPPECWTRLMDERRDEQGVFRVGAGSGFALAHFGRGGGRGFPRGGPRPFAERLRAGAKLSFPECGRACAVYDHGRRRDWRHLDTMQFKTVLRSRVPRANGPQFGAADRSGALGRPDDALHPSLRGARHRGAGELPEYDAGLRASEGQLVYCRPSYWSCGGAGAQAARA